MITCSFRNLSPRLLCRCFSSVRVRFAPSPTGMMHLGGLRTAVINYLLAKKSQGTFILRIEDTDRNRLVEGSVDSIIQSLDSFGLSPDESPSVGGQYGPYTQSERLDIYKEYASILIKNRSAYYCFCEDCSNKHCKEVDREYCSCRSLSLEETEQRVSLGDRHIIRLRMHNIPYTLHDQLRGNITISGAELDDAVLIKRDGYPTYHLASVVDDHLMNITTVVRGDEWISSFPKHLTLYEAFHWPIPSFIHLPLILSENKSKISKREGGFDLKTQLAEGYLPLALINYVLFLGLKRGDDDEKREEESENGLWFEIEDMIKEFDLSKMSRMPICVNKKRLNSINQRHIQHSIHSFIQSSLSLSPPFPPTSFPPSSIINQINSYLLTHTSFILPHDFTHWVSFFTYTDSRLQTLKDVTHYLSLLFSPSLPHPSSIALFSQIKAGPGSVFLANLTQSLHSLPEQDFKKEMIGPTLQREVERYPSERKKLMSMVRIALTGTTKGFGLSEMMELMGKKRVLERIERIESWMKSVV